MVGGRVKVVLKAALFLAGRGDQGTKFGFEEQFLTLPGAQNDHEGNGTLRELMVFCCGGGATDGPGFVEFLRFSLRHVGGIVT